MLALPTLANCWGENAASDAVREQVETEAFEKLCGELQISWGQVIQHHATPTVTKPATCVYVGLPPKYGIISEMKKSPFPGMDPYLEKRWGDVHTGLCIGIRAALQSKLPPGLRARAQEDVLLEDDDTNLRYFEPDVSVVESFEHLGGKAYGGVLLEVQPLSVTLLTFPKRARWIEILDASNGNRVVTAIEILSPGNKSVGRLNKKYVEKITEYLGAGANVVEIDLLRSGRENMLVTEDRVQESQRADYYVCTARAMRPNHWLVYPLPLRKPLPTIMIPCRETDADVPLHLQPIIDQIYLEGGHDDLDYSKPLTPPLSPEDNEWMNTLLANRAAH